MFPWTDLLVDYSDSILFLLLIFLSRVLNHEYGHFHYQNPSDTQNQIMPTIQSQPNPVDETLPLI